MSHPPKRLAANRNLTLHVAPTFSPSPDLPAPIIPQMQILPVMTERGPLIHEYLQNLYIVFHNAIADHTRVFVVRFDLRFPEDRNVDDTEQSNRIMTSFIESLKAKNQSTLTQRAGRHRCVVRYAYAREFSQTQARHHYHVVLLLNLNVYRTLGTIDYREERTLLWMIAEAWGSALQISPEEAVSRLHFAWQGDEVPSYCLKPTQDGSYGQLAEAFYRASYLSKEETKHYGQRFRGFSTSRH
jgi:hypothetical protein